ncbi:histone-fold-containing protein, partial [Hanseniaspora valbyensis NRRL Y-1626]
MDYQEEDNNDDYSSSTASNNHNQPEVSIEDLANLLPKATINKLISEIINLPRFKNLKIAVSKDYKAKITEYGIIFLQLIVGECIELILKENKKTITHEHVIKILNNLEFNDYIPLLEKVVVDKQQLLQKKQEKNLNFKKKNSLVSEEELLKQQELLFQQSRNRLNNN